VELDHSGSAAFTKTLASASAWPASQIDFNVQRCAAAKLTIAESAANTGAGFRLVALALEVAVKKSMRKLPSANRLT